MASDPTRPRSDSYWSTVTAGPNEISDILEAADRELSVNFASDWQTFLSEYRLPSLKAKFEAGGIKNPLSVLRTALKYDSRKRSIIDDSDFVELCSDLGLTVKERVVLKSAMDDFMDDQRRLQRELAKQHRSYLNLYAAHIRDRVKGKTMYTFDIALIGATFGGKTAMVKRLVNNEFTPGFNLTLGVDLNLLYLCVDPEYETPKYVKVKLWDTSGQERFRSAMPNQYFRGRDAFIFVYDVCDEHSFDEIEVWHSKMKEWVDPNEVVRVLVGNKTDLLLDQRKFTKCNTEEIQERASRLALKLDVPLYQISCKSGHNLVTMMVETVTTLCMLKEMSEDSTRTESTTQGKVNLEERLSDSSTPRIESASSRGCCSK